MPYRASLKYIPPYDRLETEEQLCDVLMELKLHYPVLTKSFEIKSLLDKPIETFKDFLTHAMKNSFVKLKCIKNMSELDVVGEIAEYDLTDLRYITWDWNKRRDGLCPGCTNSETEFIHYGLTRVTCKIMDSTKRKPVCPHYDAKVKNASGEPARRLETIIGEFTSETV